MIHICKSVTRFVKIYNKQIEKTKINRKNDEKILKNNKEYCKLGITNLLHIHMGKGNW